MDNTFLKEILGDEGNAALKRVVDRAPIFKSIVVPRAIISWLSVMSKLGYEGELPGTPDSYISLDKSDSEQFTGALTIEDQMYEFENADLLHVAASVGVALGLDLEPIDEQLKTKDLSKLGKGIDLLVKSRIVKTAKSAHKPKIIEDSFEEMEETIIPSEIVSSKGISKPKYFKLSKSESDKACNECGMNQFESNKFTGCICLKSLSKAIKTARQDDGFILKFNMNELDEETVSTVISVFKD